MLSLPPTVRIWLATRPADLRKSFDGLAALVRDGLRGDPLSGDIFVFRNQSADRIKLLLWEEDGYAIWYKRLEAGTFQKLDPAPRAGHASGSAGLELTATDFTLLLTGIDLATARRRKRYTRAV